MSDPKMTEEEIRASIQRTTQLSVQLLKLCEGWCEGQFATQNNPGRVMAECVTAALQVGMVMAARLGLPAEKLQELYAEEMKLTTVHDPNCPHCLAANKAISGTPDPKSN